MSIFSDDIMAGIAMAETAGHAVGLFWTEALKCPKFDNGDTGLPSLFAAIMAEDLARKAPDLNDEQLAAFAENVAILVDDRLSDGYRVSIGVDYGPDWELIKAAEAADIVGAVKHRWPWKTNVDIASDGCVRVSYGYGAPWITIWEPKEAVEL